MLTVQQNLLGTQQALSLSEADVSVSLISLFKALGGGWETVFPATDSKGDQATTGTERTVSVQPPRHEVKFFMGISGMNLDASRFRIHNVSAFPYVVFDGLAMTPSYASEWAKEMDALVEFGKPFVVVYERMHAGEDHEDRKLRGKWLKLNKHALSLCCKAVISIEPDEARRGNPRHRRNGCQGVRYSA